jgi:cysteinyl-tRNA synthetase
MGARKNKDYQKSDEIRNMLLEKGIALLDTPKGTEWRIKYTVT